MTFLDMSDSLFTAPTLEMHVSYYDDELRWLINDYYYDVDLLCSYASLLECFSFRLHTFIHV
jgi:hypothetical protein